MKKLNRKTKIVMALVVLVLFASLFAVVRMSDSRQCQAVIGDGWAMRTDPEPVIVGNTCN